MNYEGHTVKELQKLLRDRYGRATWTSYARKDEAVQALAERGSIAQRLLDGQARVDQGLPFNPMIARPEKVEASALPSKPRIEPDPSNNGNGEAQKAEQLIAILKSLGTVDSDQVRAIVTEETERSWEVMKAFMDTYKTPIVQIEIKTATGEVKSIGAQHYLFNKVLYGAQKREAQYLYGPSGSGKTHIAHSIGEALSLPVYTLSLCFQTPAYLITGFVSQVTGDYVPSTFYKAFKQGGVFLADEWDRGNENTIVQMNEALSNNTMTFPNGETVNQHPDFVMIAGGNTAGRGKDRTFTAANKLDGSTIARFSYLHFPIDENLERTLAGENDRTRPWIDFCQKARKAGEELKILDLIVTPRDTIKGAEDVMNKNCPFTMDELRERHIFKGISEDSKNKIIAYCNN